jgi:hypothetical protein
MWWFKVERSSQFWGLKDEAVKTLIYVANDLYYYLLFHFYDHLGKIIPPHWNLSKLHTDLGRDR